MTLKTFAIRDEAFLVLNYTRGKERLEKVDYSWDTIFSIGFSVADKIILENQILIVPRNSKRRDMRAGYDFQEGHFEKMSEYAKKLNVKKSEMIEMFLWSYVRANFTKREVDFFNLDDWTYYVEPREL